MLDKIVEVKKQEVLDLKLREKEDVTRYSLFERLSNPNRSIGLIAEVKKASPSKGIIKENFNPLEIAKQYEVGGADALSVLTDQKFFLGHHSFLTEIKKDVNLPLLRKDFIIDSKQIEESVRMGADAILLIAAILDRTQLHEFYQEAYEKGLECLVEVHSEKELENVFSKFQPQMLGINNRNLQTFETNLTQTIEIGRQLPKDQFVISESGIVTLDDLQQVKDYVRAVLVGETFMRAKTPLIGIQTLFGEVDHETFA
ncbi:indole-3-glycerol phosphate synthase TrpC [Anaerobacillus sp. CMMVII]|uniref:indole-3-glycerol phosphate synthase TrpC n=1 Tax=Anaerobacillus sp. CMMVII TaxID=2755588 RepID=UPI0021B82035|nr:indole-3-glycerol phosphate synthase TrpC [Anaerobacillus sp. CMMVII]MCT8138898.1 indole-3-glycerol phosphate synthase TrpC [Anaerobacillus sp. CMMVII]